MKKKTYAFRHKNEVLLESSSGGAFTALANVIISRGGVVFGACFDKELNVVHKKAETIEECFKFRGSKYIQSSMTGVFIQIKECLENGRIVLFTGTPCQIKAVKNYCNKSSINIDNLVLVDIICHGAMRPDVWQKFRQWIEGKHHSRIVHINFRYKKTRWHSYPIQIEFENGKVLTNTFDARRFNELFFSSIALLNGCYKCPFSNMDRESDITIGDFWGIQKVMPQFPVGNGTSEIIVNTEKGKDLITEILSDPEILIQECLTDEYIKYQHNLNSPTAMPRNAVKFREDFKNIEFIEILKKYAEYNFTGRIKHCIKRLAGELGITEMLKRYI